MKPKKRACDSCHRRKIQCDATEPQCNWCKHHDLDCTFNRAYRVKKTKPTGKTEAKESKAGQDPSVAQRIERLEQILARNLKRVEEESLLADFTPDPSPTTAGGTCDSPQQSILSSRTSSESQPGPGAPSPGASFGKLHFAGYHLGEISSYNGVPFFSRSGQEWIQLRTGEESTFQNLCASGPPWQIQPATQHPDCPSTLQDFNPSLDLPPRKVVEDCLKAYRASFFKLIFPVIDSALFDQTIEAAYEPWPGPSSQGAVQARACVFAFLSVMSILTIEISQPPKVDLTPYPAKVQFLLPRILQETNIVVLETVLMACLLHIFTGHLQKAAMMHSLACRLMFMLGAHTLANPHLTPIQPGTDGDQTRRVKLHLRGLFWLCYALDKEISLRTGQPPSIDDDNCDLTLPTGYVERQYDRTFAAEQDATQSDEVVQALFPGDLRLTILKSKTCKALYSVAALRKSDAHLLRDIRELDDELEKWRVSVPPPFRPTLSFTKHSMQEFHNRPHLRMSVLMTKFEYHYLMGAIHQVSGRCRAWANGESGVIEGVSSSLALSVEASRSTLLYLRAGMDSLAAEAFWMVVFYPVTAILCVFCNVLLNPQGDRIIEDMGLLSWAPELIKRMRDRKIMKDDSLHIKMLDDFVAELSRLAACAVEKARREVEDQLADKGQMALT